MHGVRHDLPGSDLLQGHPRLRPGVPDGAEDTKPRRDSTKGRCFWSSGRSCGQRPGGIKYKEDAVLTEDCGKKQRSNCHSFRLSALLTEVIQHPQYFGTWQEFHRSPIRFGLKCDLLYENTVYRNEGKGLKISAYLKL